MNYNLKCLPLLLEFYFKTPKSYKVFVLLFFRHLLPIFQKLGELVVVMAGNLTVENIVWHVFRYVCSRCLPVTRVRLWETVNSYADFA